MFIGKEPEERGQVEREERGRWWREGTQELMRTELFRSMFLNFKIPGVLKLFLAGICFSLNYIGIRCVVSMLWIL